MLGIWREGFEAASDAAAAATSKRQTRVVRRVPGGWVMGAGRWLSAQLSLAPGTAGTHRQSQVGVPWEQPLPGVPALSQEVAVQGKPQPGAPLAQRRAQLIRSRLLMLQNSPSVPTISNYMH